MMFSRLKYLDLYCCLAKATGLRCFVASQPIIKFMHFHGQFLIQKVAACGQKIFCGALMVMHDWQGRVCYLMVWYIKYVMVA